MQSYSDIKQVLSVSVRLKSSRNTKSSKTIVSSNILSLFQPANCLTWIKFFSITNTSFFFYFLFFSFFFLLFSFFPFFVPFVGYFDWLLFFPMSDSQSTVKLHHFERCLKLQNQTDKSLSQKRKQHVREARGHSA